MGEVFVHGVPRDVSEKALIANIQDTLLKATHNLKWLKKGQTVLLKPALNSPDPFPATTHPLSVKAVAELLVKRGANVYVGDQSGIEHVVMGPEGVVKGSSKKNFIASGMKGKARVTFVGFEEKAWDTWLHHKAKSWPDGFYYTSWIKQVAHVISLPRLSTHAQAGVTLGFKNFVGILREDSRLVFHQEGPFNRFITMAAKKAEISVPASRKKQFFEKMTEISLCVKKKLRCTLFVGTAAQVTIGPDARVGGIKSHVVVPETGLVFASADQVCAEVFAIAFLTLLYKEAPASARLLQKTLLKANGLAKELGTYTPWENPFVEHALKLKLGSDILTAQYMHVPADLEVALEKLL